MSKENGFVQLRRGIWEHVKDGRMSPFEALAFIYIASQADTRTGVWKGSAGALVAELGFNPRTARNVLERMERGKYIRRFATPGRHLCYPILVHKFQITHGEHDGEQLDALSSTKSDTCIECKYVPREQLASQRRIENREKRREESQNLLHGALQTSASVPAVIGLPLNSGPDYQVTQPEIGEWSELYPAVDVLQELRKMRGWLVSSPKRRKTRSGIRKFINGWLSREQDRGPRAGGDAAANQSAGGGKSFDRARNEGTDAAIKRVLGHARAMREKTQPSLLARIEPAGSGGMEKTQ